MTSKACENNSTMVITQQNELTITSPNWPNPYPPHSDCTWEIIAPRGVEIQLILNGYQLHEKYVYIYKL